MKKVEKEYETMTFAELLAEFEAEVFERGYGADCSHENDRRIDLLRGILLRRYEP